jgi:hypothetical protein
VTDDLAWLEAAGTPRLIAEIHGTVELERALAERGLDLAAAQTAVADPLLGARVVVAGTGSRAFAIAEPSTEGRLAGALARHGEGVVGRYVAAPVALAEVGRLAAAAGLVVSRTERGPFGDELVVIGGQIGARQVILVDPARVPSGG